MTPTEFASWWDFHCKRFPDSAAWLNEKGPAIKATIKESWAEAMRDVDLAAAENVTRRMVAGDEPAIPAYEREQTAAIVRKAAKRLSSEGGLSEFERERWQRREPNKAIPQGALARAVARVRELCEQSQLAPVDVAIQVADEMPEAFPDDDPYRLPRYRCPTCRDSGIVSVWSEDAFRLAKAGTLTGRESYLVASVFCSCPRGDHGQNPKYRCPRLSDNLCVCEHGNTNLEAVARFMQWVERKKPANYVASFDDWNTT